MIEVTVDQVEGVYFLKSLRILEPDDVVNGVGVHRVDPDRMGNDFIKAIKVLGLKKVGFDFSYRADLYTQYPISCIRFKVVEFTLKCYWKIIWWLYDNARLFKQIPPYQPFSWSYFTPCVWYKHLRKENQ